MLRLTVVLTVGTIGASHIILVSHGTSHGIRRDPVGFSIRRPMRPSTRERGTPRGGCVERGLKAVTDPWRAPMLAAERFMKPNASRTIPDSIYIKYLVLRNISAESPRVKSSIQIFMPTDI